MSDVHVVNYVDDTSLDRAENAHRWHVPGTCPACARGDGAQTHAREGERGAAPAYPPENRCHCKAPRVNSQAL